MAGLPLRIIAGLGNPGPEHQVTRHNAGFWFVDVLARRHGGEFRDYRPQLGNVYRGADRHDPVDHGQRAQRQYDQPGLRHDQRF